MFSRITLLYLALLCAATHLSAATTSTGKTASTMHELGDGRFDKFQRTLLDEFPE